MYCVQLAGKLMVTSSIILTAQTMAQALQLLRPAAVAAGNVRRFRQLFMLAIRTFIYGAILILPAALYSIVMILHKADNVLKIKGSLA